jgi:hypothetical protein
MKFDPDALVYPYVFVGAVAHSDAIRVGCHSSYRSSKRPGNVTEEETR